MDVKREGVVEARQRKQRILYAVGGVLFLILAVWVMQLEPAAPSVDRSQVWMDTVARGPMLRQVRGPGTLVPVVLPPSTVTQAARSSSTIGVVGSRLGTAHVIAPMLTNKDGGRHTNTSRKVSRRVASPACIAGVRVSRPNFNALWGRTKL